MSAGSFFAIFNGKGDVVSYCHVRKQGVALENGMYRAFFRWHVGDHFYHPAGFRRYPAARSRPACAKSVVLPHPDGPSKVKNSPVSIDRLTLSTAVKSPKLFDDIFDFQQCHHAPFTKSGVFYQNWLEAKVATD
jgi:hypothetical protein